MSRDRYKNVTAIGLVSIWICTGSALAQPFKVGDPVEASPTGNEFINGTVVEADLQSNSYIVHFDNYITPELRVSTRNIRARAAGNQNLQVPGNGVGANMQGAQQMHGEPVQQNQVAGKPIQPGARIAALPPANGIGGQFQENIRAKYAGSASGDQTKTVTFLSWSMTGPAPYRLKVGTSLLDPGKPIANAYQIHTKFLVDTYYAGSGAHNLNTIEGPFLGWYDDATRQIMTTPLAMGRNTSVYVPGR